MAESDCPKRWTPTELVEIDELPTDIIEMEEEFEPVPTIPEQKAIILASDISEENQSMLKGLVEMNAVATTLATLRNEETMEQRKTVLAAWCESFVDARMRNNATAETLKARLLNRLIDNIENLDLETTAKIYNDLTDVSNVDAQQAMANINGSAGMQTGAGPGINLTINNATAEGSAITTNTLNVDNQQQISHLKETASLNNSLKAWGEIPTKSRITVNQSEE